jgi:hypothetical protein
MRTARVRTATPTVRGGPFSRGVQRQRVCEAMQRAAIVVLALGWARPLDATDCGTSSNPTNNCCDWNQYDEDGSSDNSFKTCASCQHTDSNCGAGSALTLCEGDSQVDTSVCTICGQGTYAKISQFRTSNWKGTIKYFRTCEACAETCPAGSRKTNLCSATENGCAQCDAGQFYAGGTSTTCAPCAAGKYSAPGAATCILCEAGKSQPQAGQTSCSICGPDSYAPGFGQSLLGSVRRREKYIGSGGFV